MHQSSSHDLSGYCRGILRFQREQRLRLWQCFFLSNCRRDKGIVEIISAAVRVAARSKGNFLSSEMSLVSSYVCTWSIKPNHLRTREDKECESDMHNARTHTHTHIRTHATYSAQEPPKSTKISSFLFTIGPRQGTLDHRPSISFLDEIYCQNERNNTEQRQEKKKKKEKKEKEHRLASAENLNPLSGFILPHVGQTIDLSIKTRPRPENHVPTIPSPNTPTLFIPP